MYRERQVNLPFLHNVCIYFVRTITKSKHDMTEKEQHLNVGDLVRAKPLTQSKKKGYAGIAAKLDETSPFNNDLGVVVEVVLNNNTKHSYVVVLWQKLAKQFSHFSSSLERI